MYNGPERKLNRWQGYDYSMPGLYFVTICTKDKEEFFGEIKDYKMRLNGMGEIASKYLQVIPRHYKNLELDEFVIMPNHIHGIIYITEIESIGADNVGTEYYSVPTVTQSPNRTAPIDRHYGLLSKIVKSFKHATTRNIRQQFHDNHFAWQRSFHDRVIRSEKELQNIRDYIANNPVNWENDKNNLLNIK